MPADARDEIADLREEIAAERERLAGERERDRPDREQHREQHWNSPGTSGRSSSRTSAGEAFGQLRSVSQRLNRELSDVAQPLAETGEIPQSRKSRSRSSKAAASPRRGPGIL